MTSAPACGNAAGFGDGLHLAHGDGAGGVHDVEVRCRRRRTTATPSAPRGGATCSTRPGRSASAHVIRPTPTELVGGDVELVVDPRRVAVATADEPQATGCRDSGGQRPAGDAGHRCVDDDGKVTHVSGSATR